MKRTPLCMLPPPFNVISAVVWPWDEYERRKRKADVHDDEVPSVCGTASDVVIAMLTAPVCAAAEVVLVNVEVWRSPAPRHTAVLFSLLCVAVFPLVYAVFLALIVDGARRASRRFTRYSRRTKRILYGDDELSGAAPPPDWALQLAERVAVMGTAAAATQGEVSARPPTDSGSSGGGGGGAAPRQSLPAADHISSSRDGSERGPGDDALYGGDMHLFFSSFHLPSRATAASFLGRKPNIYLRVTYAGASEVVPLFKWRHDGPTWAVNYEMTFALAENNARSSLLIEAYDKDVPSLDWSSAPGLVRFLFWSCGREERRGGASR